MEPTDMSRLSTRLLIWLVVTIFSSHQALAKSGMSRELGILYRYDSAKSPTSSYLNHEFQLFALAPFKAFWIGGECVYAQITNSSNKSSRLDAGALAKYWIVDPGSGVGLNITTGAAIGRQNNGNDPVSTFTLKAGPELAWFISEGAAISTTIQYASRRAGPTYTVIGIHSGASLFF
jgi:hypothetical protein